MDTAEFDKLRNSVSPAVKEGLDFVVKLLYAVEHGAAQEEKKSA